jgi:hypothetical protein
MTEMDLVGHWVPSAMDNVSSARRDTLMQVFKNQDSEFRKDHTNSAREIGGTWTLKDGTITATPATVIGMPMSKVLSDNPEYKDMAEPTIYRAGAGTITLSMPGKKLVVIFEKKPGSNTVSASRDYPGIVMFPERSGLYARDDATSRLEQELAKPS